jgi:hypothetical protein
MALKKFMIVSALMVFLASSQAVTAQINIPSAEFEHQPVESPDSTRPFATPGIFDYDAQVFAPIEFTNGDEKDPNTGFFLTYDRLYTSVSRPGRVGDSDSTAFALGTNYIWGTKCEAGWMTDDEHGWMFGYQNSAGNFTTNGNDEVIETPMLVTNRFASVEINKIFRQSMSNGGYMEPYLGLRYLNVNDQTIEDTFQQLGLVIDGNRFKQEVNNTSVGFQAGSRFNRRRGRWRTTADVAVAATYNQQRYFATDIFRDWIPVANDFRTSVTETYTQDQSFLPMIDFQYEIAFNISRDISLRTGFQTVYLFNGVARANTLTTGLNPNSAFGGGDGAGLHNDRFVSAGFLFGFEWKR